FALMHWLAQGKAAPGARGGFIHVPALPEQAARKPGMPSMSLADQVAAVRETIRTALTVSQDLKENAGQLH
ncbi:MAG TPA: pyroglutamyl-peptidase I, partial [Pseudorhodoferax sp.]|nr:pyroglutamyl-peptidase I [Pseudorhodoferax sp.]